MDVFGGTDTSSSPLLPGAPEEGPMVTAILFDAVLLEPGIHTKSHFAGELRTHDFFSREALHASLFDIWQTEAPEVYVPDEIPYASTPLMATNPSYVTLRYATPSSFEGVAPSHRGLTQGTMQAMAPGTLFRAAVWGNADALPDIFKGRTFRIGKRRAAMRVIHATRKDVRIVTSRSTDVVLPIQMGRDTLLDPSFRTMAYKRRCHTDRYVLLDMWLDRRIPRFVIDDVTVPALDFVNEAQA